MTAYYNEIDPAAAYILRHMISAGVIAPGVVDTRSIKEVTADDIRGYTQCHWFAGGGFWSIAARLGGWPDDEPIWTASCPCQPFSAAGKGLGTDDPRHLWPDLRRIVRGARERGRGPSVLVGEQVAGSPGYNWFHGVRADLAAERYRARTVDIPACSVDAPHQRNRLYWVALDHRVGAGSQGHARHDGGANGRGIPDRSTAPTDGRNSDVGNRSASGVREPDSVDGREIEAGRPDLREPLRNGSYWSDAEWIECHDGKARRAKSGLRLLVDGIPGRVDLWRVGGNAIVPALAAEVLAALREVIKEARQ